MKHSNTKYTLTAATLLGALALPLAAQAQHSYKYQAIDLPGSGSTEIFGVNDRGQAAGNGLIENDDGTAFIGSVAFTYDVKKGDFTIIDDVAGFDSTAALSVNNRGDIVGVVADFDTGQQSALILDKNGTAIVFDHPDAVSQTSARAVNSRGLVTGIRDSSEPSSFLASFIYDPDSETFTDIVPSLLTIAQGINGRGDVVGSAIFFAEDDPCDSGAPAGGIVRYGWLRTSEGDVRYFTVNGLRTSARGLTDSGTIAGFTQDLATGETAGFVTELGDGECQDIFVSADALIMFPGSTTTFAQAMTNSGVVVGSYVDEDGRSHGFVATPR